MLQAYASYSTVLNKIIAEAREREAGEITPLSAEHSANLNEDEANHGAWRAIDANLGTISTAVAGLDGIVWIKVTLDKLYCVQRGKRLRSNGTPRFTWICSDTDCKRCAGNSCESYTMTVGTDRAALDLPPATDCKYGDFVKLETTVDSQIRMMDFVILGLPRKLNVLSYFLNSTRIFEPGSMGDTQLSFFYPCESCKQPSI